MSGKFIVIEGPDGSGKTTLARGLRGLLVGQSKSVYLTAEPTVRPIGQLLRSYLTHDRPMPDWDVLALLFAADRLDHMRNEIEPELAKGSTVISDRYTLSNLVYQTVFRSPGVTAEKAALFIAAANRYAIVPDVMIVLSVPLETTMARITSRVARPTTLEDGLMQKKVHVAYAEFVASHSSSGLAHDLFELAPEPISTAGDVAAIALALLDAAEKNAYDPKTYE